jgi:hypothetical protein
MFEAYLESFNVLSARVIASTLSVKALSATVIALFMLSTVSRAVLSGSVDPECIEPKTSIFVNDRAKMAARQLSSH